MGIMALDMVQGIVPAGIDFAAVGVGTGVILSCQKEAGNEEEQLNRYRGAGGNGGAEMEKSNDIGKNQLEKIKGVGSFHGRSPQKRGISCIL